MKSLSLIVCLLLRFSLFAQVESLDQLIAHYTLQIKLYPDSISNYISRSNAYNNKKEFVSAIADCNKILQIAPKNRDGLKARGLAYYNLKRYDSSITDLTEVLKQNVADSQAWNWRGLNYYWLNQLDKAVNDFTEALRLNPKYANAWFNRGNTFYWQGKYDEAIGDISESLVYDNTNAEAWYTRGMCYIYAVKFEPAIADFTKALAIAPGSMNMLNGRGLGYLKTGKYELAITDLTESIRINPTNTFAWICRGNTYTNTSQYDLAVTDYTQALLIDANDTEALYKRGLVYHYMDKPENALTDFSQVLKLVPLHQQALGYRGDVYTELMKFDLALKDYNAALQLNAKNTDVLTGRGICYKKMNKPALALKDFTEAVQSNPKSFYALKNRGDFYSGIFEYDAATKDYSEAINIDPTAFEPRNNRGNIFFYQKKYDLAASDYTMVLLQHPSYAPALSNRGYVYKFQKKYELAIADLSQAIALEPTAAISWSKRGVVYMDVFKYDSALYDFNKALRLNPSDTITLNSRGMLFSNQKKYNEAIADFSKALMINPTYTDALNNRALVYYKLDKYKLAIDDFKLALQAKPDNSHLLINLILVYLATDQLTDAATLYTQYRQKKLSSFIEAFASYSFLKNYITACCDYMLKKDYQNALELLQASLEDYKEANQNTTNDIPVSFEYCNVLIKTALVNEKLGQTEKALELYRKALVISPQLTDIQSKIKLISDKTKNEVAANNMPPEIQLLTPPLLRGTMVENTNNTNELFISGTVKDNAGINWIKVNGKDIPIQPGGYFSTTIKTGAAAFTIQSANKNGLIASSNYQLQPRQNSKSEEENIPPIPPTEKPKFHAVLIACSNYSGGKWKKLPTTREEAMAYKNVLVKNYGFKSEDILEVVDKERRDILNLLSSKTQSLDSNDNLIILFSGHGTFTRGEKGSEAIGYWVPLNAESPVDYISNGNLNEIVYACKAKHILMLSDACYSAAMKGNDEAELVRLSERKEWQFKSRQILTSGGFEKVPSESVFINMVIKALEINEQKVLSVKLLYNQIFNGVHNQTNQEPELNIFGKDGNEGGQFYFIKEK